MWESCLFCLWGVEIVFERGENNFFNASNLGGELVCIFQFVYFVFRVFFTHAFMRLLSVSGIYRLIQSCCCLHLQLIDNSNRLNCIRAIYNFEHFMFVMCSVTNCQRRRLLGSKTLGTNVLELQFVLCWKTMIKTQSLGLGLLKVCLFVKLELSDCRIYWTKSAGLD